MERFPFSKREWRVVRDAAREVADATSGALPSRRAARWADFKAALTALHDKHGEHPALLETEADFTSDPPAAVALYRRAEELAVGHALPTLSIRISLARLLLEDLGQPAAARAALVACQPELSAAGPIEDQTWNALLAECDRQAPPLGETPTPSGMKTPVPAPAAGLTLRTPARPTPPRAAPIPRPVQRTS
jgi:hypothetical protein